MGYLCGYQTGYQDNCVIPSLFNGRCTCTSPCNCVLAEDGFTAGSSQFYIPHAELGRNFTQIEGSGSSTDPYVIHFLDQQEFRPRSAEMRINDTSVASSSSLTFLGSGGTPPKGSIVYQSPINFVIVEENYGYPHYVEGNFFIIGASVTFPEVSETNTNYKALVLQSTMGSLISLAERANGAQTVAASGGDPITLSCEGYMIGSFVQTPQFGNIVQAFALYVFQQSGTPLLVTDIRIWVTQI